MPNIRIIRSHYEKMKEAAEIALEKKEEKDNPSDKDEAIIAALEEFLEATEAAFDELEGEYQS